MDSSSELHDQTRCAEDGYKDGRAATQHIPMSRVGFVKLGRCIHSHSGGGELVGNRVVSAICSHFLSLHYSNFLYRTHVATGDHIKSCRRLPTTKPDGHQPPLTADLFRKLQHFAARTISFTEAEKALRQRKVDRGVRFVSYNPRDILHATETITERNPEAETTLPALCMRFSHLLRDFTGVDQFAAEVLQLHYLGFDANTGEVKLVAKGVMRRAERLPGILSQTRQDDIAFNDGGSFALVLRTGLGTSCVDSLVAQLQTIGRVTNIADVLKTKGLVCNEISLSRIVFTYAENLTVEILFNAKDSSKITIKLANDNPHRRILVPLQDILNNRYAGFKDFVAALTFSLPLLRAFDAIEATNALSTSLTTRPSIHIRNADSFRLSYHSPQCVFEIRTKCTRDDQEWQIVDPHAQERAKNATPFSEGLKALFRQVGKGWTGMHSSIVADNDGVAAAVVALDAVVKSFAPGKDGPVAAAPKKDTEVITLD
jgi:mediator of RNA polymerase II transcription subunit 14